MLAPRSLAAWTALLLATPFAHASNAWMEHNVQHGFMYDKGTVGIDPTEGFTFALFPKRTILLCSPLTSLPPVG
jgi:hypothetical protein